MASLGKKLFRDILQQQCDMALDERKDKRRKNHGPLWAFIRGAYGYGAYGIEKVQAGTVRFPWAAYRTSGELLHKRLCESHKISWIQKKWLMDYIAGRYPGRYEKKFTVLDDYRFREQSKPYAVSVSRDVEHFVYEQIEKIFKNSMVTPPLKAILSPEVTISINIKFMERFL